MSSYNYQTLLGADTLDADSIIVDELDASTVHISKYLYVDAPGTAIINEIVIPTGAQNGYVLTSDAIGTATWQPQSVPTLVGDASGSVGSNQVNTLANGTIAVNTLVTLNGVQTLTNKTITGSLTGTLFGDCLGNANTASSVTLSGQVTGFNNSTVIANASVISKVLTGYVSGAGTITAADSILSAIQKLNGNTAAPAVGGELSGTIANATLLNSAVIAKVLTGYSSTTGTITAADSILTAIRKLNGNSTGVSTATASRLALRDASAGCAFNILTTTAINANGNISIAGTSPCLQANAGNATLAGYCSAALAYFSDSALADIAYRNLSGSLRFGTSAGASQMQITTAGVGVNGIINFPGSAAVKKIDLFNVTAATNMQYYGFGISASQLDYNIDSTAANHVFYAGTGASSRNELMRVTGTGNLAVNGNITGKRPVITGLNLTATIADSGTWYRLTSNSLILPTMPNAAAAGVWFTVTSIGGFCNINSAGGSVYGVVINAGVPPTFAYRSAAGISTNTTNSTIRIICDGVGWVIESSFGWF